MMLTLAADEVARGWGGPLGLLAAVAIFCVIVGAVEHFKTRTPSPTPLVDDTDGVSPLVEEVSDTDDTDPDTTPDTPWWGDIVDLADGRRVRRFAHVLRTGSSLPPDAEIDLALDDRDESAEEELGELETVEEYVDRLDRQGVAYAEIVRRAMTAYEVSEATAKRRIRLMREARQP